MPLLPQDRWTLSPSHRIRLAAVVALVATVGILTIAVSLVLHLADVLLALGCVFVLAFSGWFVFTRPGLVRLLGVPGALLGIVGLIAFVGAHGPLLFALIAALTVFGVAARYAVSQDDEARLHMMDMRPVQPPRKGVLIINPNSGGGKAERFNLPEEARKRGVEPLLLGAGTDLRELATQAVADGADVIGMAGGDGSQSLVAAVAMQHDVAHVCVPAGTRNHFAVDLGLDRDDVIGALDAFTEGAERRIDLACVNDRIFVNNASLGVYARVVQSDAYRDAKFGTWKQMLPEMLGPKSSPIDLVFDGPDARDWPGAALVLVSNNPYQLRRFRGAGKRPRLDTGRLGIVATRIQGAGAVARMVTLGTVGLSRRFRGLREWSSPEFEVRSGGTVAVGLDGEALVLAPPLRFASLPGVLRVRVPRQAPGPSAAAVALSRCDLRRLIRIAVGEPKGGAK